MATPSAPDATIKISDNRNAGDHLPEEAQTGAHSEAYALLQQQSAGKKTEALSKILSLDTSSMDALYGKKTSETNFAQTRDRLTATVAKSFKGSLDKQAAFEKNMSTFESRMGKGSQDDVQKTYAEVQRLLETQSSVVSSESKQTIAQDVMERTAHPTQSNQGASNDCAAAGIENRLYTKNPVIAAKLVTDVTLTGQYTDATGNKVSIDKQSIAKHQTSLGTQPNDIGLEVRSHGDQIMQLIVRNEELANISRVAGMSSVGENGIKYSLHDPTPENPSGESVLNHATDPPTDMTKEFIGGMQNVSLNEVYRNLSGNSNETAANIYLRDDDHSIPNATSFEQALTSMQKDFPVMVVVNTSQEPFATEMGMKNSPAQDHAITVESYDEHTGMINFRNSNFGSRDYSLNAEKMYDATRVHQTEGFMVVTPLRLLEAAKDPSVTLKELGTAVYEVLEETETKQRKDLYREFENKIGSETFKNYLSAQQKQALGIEE